MTEQRPSDARAASVEDLSAKDPEELQRDIERTRTELGDTVDALSRKADVKAQVKAAADQQRAKLEGLKQRLAERSGEGGGADVAQRMASDLGERASRQPLPYLGGALAVGVVLGRFLAPRRRPR